MTYPAAGTHRPGRSGVNCYGSTIATVSAFDRAVLATLKDARGFWRVQGMPVRTIAVLLERRAFAAKGVGPVLNTLPAARRWRSGLNQRLRRALARLEAAGLVERHGKAWRVTR